VINSRENAAIDYELPARRAAGSRFLSVAFFHRLFSIFRHTSTVFI
jgi:hypothetical protein